jgi:hypothetical protein
MLHICNFQWEDWFSCYLQKFLLYLALQWEVEFSKVGTQLVCSYILFWTHLVCLYILFYVPRIQFGTSKGQHVTHHTFFGNLKGLVVFLCTRRQH